MYICREECVPISSAAAANSRSGNPPVYLACRLCLPLLCVPLVSNQNLSITFLPECIVLAQVQLVCVCHQPLSAIDQVS